MTNPLLQTDTLPKFSSIRPEHVEPAISAVLEENRQLVETLVQQQQPTWQSLIEPLEKAAHRLDQVWSPVGHLNAVSNDEQLRKAYNRCLVMLSDYSTELSHDHRLYRAYLAVRDSSPNLTAAQHKLLQLAIEEFELAGVALEGNAKQRFKDIMQRLTRLQSKFEENLLDCSNAWRHHVTDPAVLEGIPPHALQRAAEQAASEDLEGWSFTLDYPAYDAVVSHAHDTDLRQHFYTAWVTRASDQGPHDKRYDNTGVMEEILELRHEAARLVGFQNFAEYSLATKMANSVDQVKGFLEDLAHRSYPVAQHEFEQLQSFAGHELEAWDVSYYGEQLREHRFGLNDEVLRPFFPVEKVISGMFDIVHRLYGLEITERHDVDSWNEEVRFFDVTDSSGAYRGGFYTDLYARQSKRGGAWMGDCIGRIRLSGETADPIAYLNCNFAPAADGHPALLSHREVLTLFHEFGHVLHHIVTQVDYPSVAGINGVAWDAVELPSQFMENFCWNRATLPMISAHYETGEPLPDELFERLLGMRNFNAGMSMLRQLEFALFDIRMHAEYQPEKPLIYPILEAVRDRIAVAPTPSFNRFPHSFSHIFGGGYAAGYYSYKWAEVLSADAFAAFEEAGVLDAATGARFLQSILQRGGGVDAMQAFVDFRGREPQLEPLLRHSGIAA